ncbi:MAG: hypothetical protein Kow0069_12960 [Promethearchaeota archaeon]
MVVERTLVFIKPEVAARPQVAARVLRRLLSDPQMRLLSFIRFIVPEALAREHYAEHEKKPFFPTLVTQITAAPVYVCVFEGEGVIAHVRKLAGATFVENAEPGTIRADFGLYKGLNVIHASDGPESAEREINLWQKYGAVHLEPEEAQHAAWIVVQTWQNHPHESERIRKIIYRILEEKANLRAFLRADAVDPSIEPGHISRLIEAIFRYVME